MFNIVLKNKLRKYLYKLFSSSYICKILLYCYSIQSLLLYISHFILYVLQLSNIQEVHFKFVAFRFSKSITVAIVSSFFMMFGNVLKSHIVYYIIIEILVSCIVFIYDLCMKNYYLCIIYLLFHHRHVLTKRQRE